MAQVELVPSDALALLIILGVLAIAIERVTEFFSDLFTLWGVIVDVNPKLEQRKALEAQLQAVGTGDARRASQLRRQLEELKTAIAKDEGRRRVWNILISFIIAVIFTFVGRLGFIGALGFTGLPAINSYAFWDYLITAFLLTGGAEPMHSVLKWLEATKKLRKGE